MAWYLDLTPCDYFGEALAPSLRAVGWLEPDHALSSKEKADRAVYDKLTLLLREPWQPALLRGVHSCGFCQFEPTRGSANVFIPGEGCVYVCPELILHYMNCHGYAPPPIFCAAVLTCPPMRSTGYFKALLKAGGRNLVSARKS